MKRALVVLAAAWAVGIARADANIVETHDLAVGWNAIYLEATPTNADCRAVFGDCPHVTRVGCYVSDAYTSTAQYDSEGKAINQQPVSYLAWFREDEDASTLKNVAGGNCYLLFATNACTLSVTGRPQLPRISWRDTTSGDALLNLAGASLPETASVTSEKYFGEGPAGSGSAIYIVRGTGAAPTVAEAPTGARYQLTPGQAYFLPAASATVWPGVVGVTGADGGLVIGSNDSARTSFRLQNLGTKEHTFRLSYGSGADGAQAPALLYLEGLVWTNLATRGAIDLTLGSQESATLNFAADRTLDNAIGAGMLTISDLGDSKMRVRVPVVIEARTHTVENADWPDGLFLGSFELNAVTYSTNKTPSAAGGTLKGTLIYHSQNGKSVLLQRVIYGVDAQGQKFFTQNLDTARELVSENTDEKKSLRRISSVVLDPQQPAITGTVAEASATFEWKVGKYASTNPMRHSWHPDHDGVRYLTDGTKELAPDGDDMANYQYSVKPELFSIGNKVTLSSIPRKDDGNSVDEAVSGTISWELDGLKSENNGKILCTGTYTLQRVSSNAELK